MFWCSLSANAYNWTCKFKGVGGGIGVNELAMMVLDLRDKLQLMGSRCSCKPLKRKMCHWTGVIQLPLVFHCHSEYLYLVWPLVAP